MASMFKFKIINKKGILLSTCLEIALLILYHNSIFSKIYRPNGIVMAVTITTAYIRYYPLALTFKAIYLDIKYTKLCNLIGNCVVIDKAKKNGKEFYTLNSFTPISDILGREKDIEQYLNTNVIGIYHKFKTNKRLIVIKCSKLPISEHSGAVKKLSQALKHFGFTHDIVSFSENEFTYNVDVTIQAEVNKVKAKLQEIIFIVGCPINLKADNNIFYFQIIKKEIKLFHFQDYIKEIPKNMELPFLTGLDHNTGKEIYLDLVKTLHLFINGKTGSGKSCLFNTIIQSLQAFNNDKLVMVDIDFKGNEFLQYEELKTHVFINAIDGFKTFLTWVTKELNNRYVQFGKAKNIGQYNQGRNIKMPYLIINIDEVAFISLSGNKELFEDMSNIINMGRACGILFMCATQRPEHTIVPTMFRNQFDTYYVGRLGRVEDNKVCGISKEIETDKFNTGEFLMSLNGKESKIQALFISEVDISKHLVYKCLRDNFEPNNNINLGKEDATTTRLKNIIKTPSKQCFELINEIKKALNYREIDNNLNVIEKKGNQEKDDLYILFLEWIKEACNPGDRCPKLDEALEKFPEMTAKKYRSIKERAKKDGNLYQISKKGIYYVK